MDQDPVNEPSGGKTPPARSSSALDKDSLVRLTHMEGLPDAGQDAIFEHACKLSGIPPFEGVVLHGYSSKRVHDLDVCPRCGAATRRHYARLIYNTQRSLRIMMVPAGLFCTKCPSVVVEEDLLISGISNHQYKYLFTVGVDFGVKRPPEFFTSWNDEDLVYFLDEDEFPERVVTASSLEQEKKRAGLTQATLSLTAARKRAVAKRREKQAKQSRKKNRKE